jgi:hypothetical protein
MNIKTKHIRICWKDLRKLRRLIPPRKDEFASDYMHRVIERIEKEVKKE